MSATNKRIAWIALIACAIALLMVNGLCVVTATAADVTFVVN